MLNHPMIARCRRYLAALLGAAALTHLPAFAAEPAVPAGRGEAASEFHLRGYRGIRHQSQLLGEAPQAVALHRLVFDDATHAQWFVSKLYGDFALSQGNTVREVATIRGPADAIDLGGPGLILPLLAAGAREVTVLAGPAAAVVEQAGRIAAAAPLRRAALSHPLYLDKWDRYPLGCWTQINEAERGDFANSLDDLFTWMGRMQLTAQLDTAYLTQDLVTNDNLLSMFRRQLARHGVNYQRVEWLANQVDLYNRNPFFVSGRNPSVAMRGDYYGERTLRGNPYRTVQNATIVDVFRRTAGDANQMALLDPDGEIGPFNEAYWGLYGPVNRREFVRFLQQVRKLSLAELSRRYTGRADAYRSWDDVRLVDWRLFYGWTDGAQDLAGPWRFQRDDRQEGFARGWSLPGHDDSGWVCLHYPGDALVFGLPRADKALWMRKTFTPRGNWPGRVYLSLAPLCRNTVQVFVNGTPAGTADPRFHTAWIWGQFDVTEEVRRGGPITVALRFSAGDCPQGPIFLTPQKAEDFPTADSRLNARRWDHMEFIDWAVAQTVASTLETLRSVDADRPIKVHAYAMSPWGWDTVARYGGFSHHTGSGPGWQWTEPKQYGSAFALQDSSEPGSPVSTLRDFRGIWGSLIFMGKNAHDYFLSVHDITGDPAKRAYFEAKAASIKVMGRANVLVSPVAAIREQLRYRSEFAHWETWRHSVSPARGGEMTPLLDELTLRKGKLDQFRAIIDEGLPCWDDEMAAALEGYVRRGGILLLGTMSGIHTYLERDKGAGPVLAGVRLGPPPGKSEKFSVQSIDPRLGSLAGSIRTASRDGTAACTLRPAAGTDVLGVWPDGTAALTRRAVGRGFVYFFANTTYPGELIAGLAKAQGLATCATAEGGFDLLRTLRSNNGTEDLLMVRGKEGKEATIRWTLEYPPERIYDPVTGRTIPARIEGRTATVTLKMDDWDFAWLAARRPGCDEHFVHWFRRQTEIWSGLVLGAQAPQAQPYRHLDLNHHWRLAHAATWTQAEALLPLTDAAAGLKPAAMILWDEAEKAAGPAALYRQDFTLPPRWEKQSELQLAIRGDVHSSKKMHGFAGRNAIYLNGQPLWSGERIDSRWRDVTAQLKPGGNRLEILHQGPGLMPTLMLVRSAVPDRTLDLAGPWRCVQTMNTETAVSVPGTARGVFLYRDVEIPQDARSQEVWLRVEDPCDFAIVNGRLRYWDIGHSNVFPKPEALEIDITPELRFGKTNRIILGNRAAMTGWQTSEFKLQRVELRLFAPGKWSWDGRPTRDGLTPGELDAVARDAELVGQYRLIPPAAVAAPRPDVQSPAARTFTRPAALLDLAAAADGGPLVDRGPGKVAVTPHGTVTPFADAGGQIRGVYLQSEGQQPGTLELANRFFQEKIAGKDFSVRVWVMPIAIHSPGGNLLDWGSELDWSIRDNDTTIMLPSVPARRQIVNTVIAPRRWQCLTLSVQGGQSDLYLNGIAVSRQTWNRPIQPSGAAVYIGSIGGKRNFLNAKLAALSIYGEALSADAVRGLYQAERDTYRTPPDKFFPENDLFRLNLASGGDEADVPSEVTVGPGVRREQEAGRPVLLFDGQASHLIVRDSPRERLFSKPYAFILDFRPEPGASGRIFRRHHANCLGLERDGTLVFDANIGRRNLVRFPKAVRFGAWNRIVLTYDGQTVTLEVNGVRAGRQAYEGTLYDAAGEFPVVFLADNTYPGFPKASNVRCKVRELRVAPRPGDLSDRL
jgi:hypothetical protein